MFAWFDTLGFDEVRTAPLVKVLRADKPSVQESVGFMTNAHGGAFDVLTLSLSRDRFTPRGGPRVRVVTISDKELGEYVESLKSLYHSMPAVLAPGQRVPAPIDPFVLARAAGSRHLETLSHQFFEVAKAAPYPPNRNESATARIRREIADIVCSSTRLEMANAAYSRTDLLAKVKSYRSHFPGSDHDAWATGLIATLERMAKEDTAHRPLPASASESQKISELVYRLRDLAPHYVETLKGGSIVARRDDTLTNLQSPAARLLQLGYKAVPALIDALPDDDLTRVPDYGNVSNDVSRVGDVALFLLQRISCKQWIPQDNGLTNVNPTDTELQAAIRGWWSAAQSAGEEKTLVSQLPEGGDTSRLSADRLVAAYPSSAVRPIVQAIDSTKFGGVRLALVTSLSGLKNGQAVEAMKREVKILPDTASRFVAAKYLASTAPDEAFSAALDIYRRIRAGSEPGSSGLQESVQETLANSGRAEAVTAIGQGLAATVASMRYQVIVQLNRDPYKGSERPSGLPLPKDPQERQRCEQAVESLLAGELDDSRRYTGTVGQSGGSGVGGGGMAPGAIVPTSRLCDYAEEVLSHRFPDRYHFVAGLSATKMEVQRINAINVWRKKTGEKPMEVPLGFR